MGIIKRQGIKQSIVTYAGVVIGMLNVLFIYPAFLERSEIGVLSWVRETAAMLGVFVFLGSSEGIIRFFPYFKDEERKHNGYLALNMLIVAAGFTILSVGWLFFKEEILHFFSKKDEAELYLQYVPYILPFTFLIAYGNLFTMYSYNFHRIVVPSIFNEIYPKVGLPLLALGYYFDLLSFEHVFWGMLLVHALITLSNMLYVRHLGQLHFNIDLSFLKRPLLKEMANFSLYGFLGSMGSRLSSEFISIFMVGTMSTLTNSGVFYIAYLISNVIDVPRKAIAKIAAPLLAEKIKEGNWEEVQEIYQKTSLNQLIIGLGLLLAVWVSIDELFHIMPNGELYEAGKMVILILGIGRVVDMVTGVNSGIISFSKYFRWNFYFILFTAIVNIAGNFILIPKFEILGAALAVLLSLVLFNAAKCLLLYWKLRMNPFTPATFYSIFFAALFGVPISLLPGPTGWVLIDLAIKSGAFLALYGGAVLFFRLSPDINSLVENALHRFKSYIGK